MQHEFGIYGGESGIYVLPLLHRLEEPLFTVLHTVLQEPSHIQKLIIQEIAARSAKVIVMSRRGIEFLIAIYGITPDKIQYIEHGVPDLEAPAINPLNKVLPFRNHKVLLTFGLLSRNKGLETVIQALPKIVERHPDVMYVILGKTHPTILRTSGEEYRDSLKRLAVRLHVDKHLTFINKFVSEEELMNYLSAAHSYVTPYLNEAQITSGTLSYAVGAGAAVVSTPYWHAQELLADNRGRLFPFKDATVLPIPY
ncbi:glycosyltransferase [Pontibacter qinzhouensis]|uniref:glycosyltransferase n=1 Tax=Pontibacter qinzhouensis TaxID=2603253 RepID=UPI002101ED28|nr:glycosyltransferase [Pontibacter qinzhouensis]